MIDIKRVDTKNESMRHMIDAIVPESFSGGAFMYVDIINRNIKGDAPQLIIINGLVLPVDSLEADGTLFIDNYSVYLENEITGKEFGSGNGFRTIEEVVAYANKEIERLKSSQLDQSSSFDVRNADWSDCEVQNLTMKGIKREILVWEAFVTRLLQNKYAEQ